MVRVSRQENELDTCRDRRSVERVALVLRVGLITDRTRTLFCLVKNISATGVQVKLYGATTVGADVTLCVGDEMPIAGRVSWVQDGSAGIEFATRLEPEMLLRAAQVREPTRRRSSPRINAAAQILLRTGGKSYAGTLQDVSASGVRVRTTRPVRLGPSVMVTLPGLPPMRAFVRWSNNLDLGLAFETRLPIEVIANWLDQRVSVSVG